MIAAAVRASLGLVSGLLVPLVALALVAMLKVGKERRRLYLVRYACLSPCECVGRLEQRLFR